MSRWVTVKTFGLVTRTVLMLTLCRHMRQLGRVPRLLPRGKTPIAMRTRPFWVRVQLMVLPSLLPEKPLSKVCRLKDPLFRQMVLVLHKKVTPTPLTSLVGVSNLTPFTSPLPLP